MTDPRVHARYLSYRERFSYFGRGPTARLLTIEEFAAFEAERARLAGLAKRSTIQDERLDELKSLLHLD